jgi:hypothetical protein
VPSVDLGHLKVRVLTPERKIGEEIALDGALYDLGLVAETPAQRYTEKTDELFSDS